VCASARTAEIEAGGRTYARREQEDEARRREGKGREASGAGTDLGAVVLLLGLDEGPELGDLEPLPFPGRPAASVRHIP
jgi:hypothetical protein